MEGSHGVRQTGAMAPNAGGAGDDEAPWASPSSPRAATPAAASTTERLAQIVRGLRHHARSLSRVAREIAQLMGQAQPPVALPPPPPPPPLPPPPPPSPSPSPPATPKFKNASTSCTPPRDGECLSRSELGSSLMRIAQEISSLASPQSTTPKSPSDRSPTPKSSTPKACQSFSPKSATSKSSSPKPTTPTSYSRHSPYTFSVFSSKSSKPILAPTNTPTSPAGSLVAVATKEAETITSCARQTNSLVQTERQQRCDASVMTDWLPPPRFHQLVLPPYRSKYLSPSASPPSQSQAPAALATKPRPCYRVIRQGYIVDPFDVTSPAHALAPAASTPVPTPAPAPATAPAPAPAATPLSQRVSLSSHSESRVIVKGHSAPASKRTIARENTLNSLAVRAAAVTGLAAPAAVAPGKRRPMSAGETAPRRAPRVASPAAFLAQPSSRSRHRQRPVSVPVPPLPPPVPQKTRSAVDRSGKGLGFRTSCRKTSSRRNRCAP